VTVLATFVGGWGHAEPLLPVARLAQARGHQVAFAGQAAVVPRLAELTRLL
jgi:UDP:flavonoid glycosyltransferase YjiC (YdhE family)